MPLTLGPIDRFALCLKCAEYVIRMIFNNVIIDTAAVRASRPGGPSAVLQRKRKRLPSFVSQFAELILFATRATSLSLSSRNASVVSAGNAITKQSSECGRSRQK
jgi:hypothetical protein